jgi:hypothetical protein
MNVLSLFDRISYGQIELNNLGIKYDNYFASEIDEKIGRQLVNGWNVKTIEHILGSLGE